MQPGAAGRVVAGADGPNELGGGGGGGAGGGGAAHASHPVKVGALIESHISISRVIWPSASSH